MNYFIFIWCKLFKKEIFIKQNLMPILIEFEVSSLWIFSFFSSLILITSFISSSSFSSSFIICLIISLFSLIFSINSFWIKVINLLSLVIFSNKFTNKTISSSLIFISMLSKYIKILKFSKFLLFESFFTSIFIEKCVLGGNYYANQSYKRTKSWFNKG